MCTRRATRPRPQAPLGATDVGGQQVLPGGGQQRPRLHQCFKYAELVSLGIGQHLPRNVALPNVDTRRSERDESLHLGDLIVRTQVEMEAVLALLRFVDGQEEEPREPIWLRPNLKHDRVVVDDYPPERFAPPPTERNRFTGGDNDLLPLKAHRQTITHRSRCGSKKGLTVTRCQPVASPSCTRSGTWLSSEA